MEEEIIIPKNGEFLVYVGEKNSNQKQKKLTLLLKDLHQFKVGELYQIEKVEYSHRSEANYYIRFHKTKNTFPSYLFEPFTPTKKEESPILTSLKERFKILSPEDEIDN